jgi:hypothetical protein
MKPGNIDRADLAWLAAVPAALLTSRRWQSSGRGFRVTARESAPGALQVEDLGDLVILVRQGPA